MKLIKGYALISQTELDNALKDAEKRGAEKGGKESTQRIKTLEKGLERKTEALEAAEDKYKATIDRKNREIEVLEAKVEVLEEEREEVRDVVKQKIDADDQLALLQSKKESIDKRTALLNDREAKIGSKEEGEYKKGYADGVADGVRKINEITQKDRDNAMKVAMVAAASHTPVANMKEINNVQALTSGLEDEEDK